MTRLDVLRERGFRLFFLAYATSLLGTYMAPVAITFAVLESGGTASDVGLVLAAQTVPLVALVLAGGVIGDRFRRKLVMVGADFLRCAAQGVLAFLLLTGDPSLAAFMVLGALLGVGQAVFTPAMNGLIPEVTSAERLQQANALRSMAMSLGRTVGPAVGGVVVAAASPGWAIALDALSYGVSSLILVRLPLPTTSRAVARSFLGELRDGWNEFRSRTWLWAIVVQFAFWHMLVLAPFMVLGAIVAKEELGGATAWGTILAAYGAGAVGGGLAMAFVQLRRPLLVATVGTFGFAPPLVFLALHAAPGLVAAGALVAGAGMGVFTALWDTTLQREVSPEARARVSSYDVFGSVAFLPIGYALVGPIAGHAGVSTTLWLSAAWLVASSALVLALPAVSRVEAGTVTPSL